MSGLKAEADPAEVGLDAERLRRIGALCVCNRRRGQP